MRHDLVEQSEPLAFARVDDLGEPDQLERFRRPDEPGQEVRAAPVGVEPDAIERLAEARAIARDAHVAREREVRAAAGRDTVHAGDHRLRRLANRRHHVASRIDERGHGFDVAPLHQLRHVGDVAARAEARGPRR